MLLGRNSNVVARFGEVLLQRGENTRISNGGEIKLQTSREEFYGPLSCASEVWVLHLISMF